MKRHELKDEQWNRIKESFPPEKKPHGGRHEKSNHLILNAILYWLTTGIPWRDLPEEFGPWQTVYSRFSTWARAGVWDRAFSVLIAEDLVDEMTVMLDRTTIQVHQHASSVKNRAQPRRMDHKPPCGNG